LRIIILGRKEFAAMFLGFLVLTSAIAWVEANPPRIEQFASLSLLGSNMSAAFYFPNNVTTVARNERVIWDVQIYNHMGSSQLFQLVVKLSNSSRTFDPGPNATSNTPSQGAVLLRSYKALLNNEMWNFPLQWSITGETTSLGPNPSTTLQSIVVNNATIQPQIPVSAVGGKNFRIVVELSSYDQQIPGFVFSFVANGVLESIFNQVWFNAG
jgi:hypothetical protein